MSWQPARSERTYRTPQWIRPRRGDGSNDHLPLRAPRLLVHARSWDSLRSVSRSAPPPTPDELHIAENVLFVRRVTKAMDDSNTRLHGPNKPRRLSGFSCSQSRVEKQGGDKGGVEWWVCWKRAARSKKPRSVWQ